MFCTTIVVLTILCVCVSGCVRLLAWVCVLCPRFFSRVCECAFSIVHVVCMCGRVVVLVWVGGSGCVRARASLRLSVCLSVCIFVCLCMSLRSYRSGLNMQGKRSDTFYIITPAAFNTANSAFQPVTRDSTRSCSVCGPEHY